MQVMEAAALLSEAIRQSPEYKEFAEFKAQVDADAPIKALVTEYKRLQNRTQMALLSGGQQSPEDMQRFQQLGSLLFADNRTSTYLLSEMRLQKLMADVFEKLTAAANMEIPL